MAGIGKRFVDKGYKLHKPLIPTFDRRTGEKYPMVICATKDLPGVGQFGSNIIYIDRTFHKREGIEDRIREFYKKAIFITTDTLTDGQACTCMLAKDIINNDEELLIAGSDNGMIFDKERFNLLKEKCDVIIFTFRNNESVLENPDSYGWVKIDNENNVVGMSIKKAISKNPVKDHAIVATFWFLKGNMFVQAANKMINENDRINNEFYVDESIQHCLDLGYKVKVFEIDRYIGWGTPKDYENYMDTIEYWKEFVNSKEFLGTNKSV
jgi:dTDP-glucose pyrophosphorylase